MVGTREQFDSAPAPCGRNVGGEHYREADDHGLVVYDQFYSCGCRQRRREFSDGSLRTMTDRHDGRRVPDDASPAHGC
jgi:hypothetical protein